MMHRTISMVLRTLLLGGIIGILTACMNPGPTPVSTQTPTLAVPTSTPTATPSDTPTPTAMPTATATPTLKPTPKVEESLFDVLFQPFMNEAQKRREQRAKNDPDYSRRVNRALNENRINILLFGYGETHEPPVTERAIIGSHTILSFDTRRRVADIISITHDTRAPEVERKLGISGKPKSATRIDQAYIFGGFDLMRQTLENVTGLSIDFQIAFDDVVIKEFVDNVYGGVEVDVPQTFQVHPFYLNGKKYPAGRFMQGRQKLNGTQVIQFIKTVPIAERAYDVSLEHNLRKHIIFEALLESLKTKCSDPGFWLNAGKFTAGEIQSGTLAYDFDHTALVKNQIGNVAINLGRYVATDKSQESSGLQFPRFDKRKYIVDKTQGDGGVRWVGPNVDDPYIRADIQAGVYANYDMEVPYNGNPYAADLANDYWCSTRSLIQVSLLNYPSLPCYPVADPQIQ
jgi:LCP family protein required for cell wall assembly